MLYRVMNLPIMMQIPEFFYKEETICGHKVSIMDKKMWAVELDLLHKFQQVCTKHQLKWYMAYGSLLGAIRHKGFIPWDNDIDVMMPREDFRKLCEIAPNEFMHPYFLSTPISESGRFYRSIAKLCNSLTTGGSEDLWLQGINCGLFIDIFILDDMPDKEKDILKLIKKANFYSHLARFLSPYPRHDKGFKAIKHWCWTMLWKYKYHQCKGDYIFKKIDDIYGSTLNKNYQHVGLFERSIKNTFIFDKSHFAKTIMTPFEMLQVPIPSGYDAILRQLYGDYMQFPSEAQRTTHPYLDIDPETPYTEYYKKRFS